MAARQDPEAFAQIYDEYGDRIVRYLVRQTLDPEVAFDLMAETFAEALDAIPRFRGKTDQEGRAWLFTIAAHQLFRWRRRGTLERRKLTELGAAVPDLGQEEFERIEQLADLQRFRPILDLALRALTDDQRRVLQLRVIEGQSYDEIAAMLGSTNIAIRQRVSRALRQLGVALGQPGDLGDQSCAQEIETAKGRQPSR